MEHELKIEENYLLNLLNGMKKVEIRLNDRDYQKDDILSFARKGTGKIIKFVVTHIHSGLGLKENYVALSVEYIKETDTQGELMEDIG